MPSKSKTKGNTFEREICKFLRNLTGFTFLRVPTSGAFLGESNMCRAEFMDKTQCRLMDGDIIVPEQWDNWAIEAKFYKDFSWKKIFQKDGESQLNKWIGQAEKTTKQYWFLLFKINNSGRYCVILKDTMYRFKFKFPECYSVYRKKYLIMDMENFFELNYESIK